MNKKQKGMLGILLAGVVAVGVMFASSANQPKGDTQANRGGGGSIGRL